MPGSCNGGFGSCCGVDADSELVDADGGGDCIDCSNALSCGVELVVLATGFDSIDVLHGLVV